MKSNSCFTYNIKTNELKESDKQVFIKSLLTISKTVPDNQKAKMLKELSGLSYDELVKKINLNKVKPGIYETQYNDVIYLFITIDKTKEDVEKFIQSTLSKNKITEEIKKHHKELNDLARKAQDAYYNSGDTIMSDNEYDNLYNKISEIENEYNYHPNWSVTQTAGIAETKISKGGKVVHEFNCLSQAKIKHDPQKLQDWMNNQECLLSEKEDGCTLVLTYDKNKLTLAASRGDGHTGQDLTKLIGTQNCIPQTIKDTGHVVIRGEYLITTKEFNRINNNLEKGENPYKNPRNLVSGLLHQQDLKIARTRQGVFHVFELVSCTGFDKIKTYEDQLNYCKSLGFDIVKYKKVNSNNLVNAINDFENNIIPKEDHPIDGLVCRYNDIAYGDKLGYTSHAPNFSVAYKFVDDIVPTTLRKIVFNPSRTGRINPIAIFDPIELEGTTVQKCTLNNMTYIKKVLGVPYIGQEIYVKKNNMIIPGLDETLTKPNNTVKTNLIPIPTVCPLCGSKLSIKNDGSAEFLMCDNPDCQAKQSKTLELFASKNAMDFDGISSATIQAFIENGLVNKPSDFYDLPNKKNELFQLEGFGQKSFDNLCKVLDNSKTIEGYRFLLALGIQGVAGSNAKEICKYFNNDFNKIMNATESDYLNIPRFGNTLAKNITKWFSIQSNRDEVNKLLGIITIKQPQTVKQPAGSSSKLNGKSFCITGSLQTLKNRDEFISLVEANGGVYMSSVKKGLDYLCTNDPNSGSAKNKKAQELGTKLITEQEFLGMIK